ncbi:MAG: tetratricopeptide repeat protein [Opitutales bacterium]
MAKLTPLHPAPERCGTTPWWLPLLVGLLATLPFWGALDHDFAWDDHLNVVNNPQIQSLNQATLTWMLTENYGGHYHPLTWLTFALNYHFSGLNPAAYIATNIILHGIAAALLCLLMQRLLEPLFPTREAKRLGFILALATLFWALHPLRVESVVWITERRNLLSGIFVLLALLAYTRFAQAEKRNWLWYGLCLIATALSLLSKAWAITLPIILLLIDLYPLKRRLQLRLLLEKIPFFILSLAFGLGALMAQSTEALAKLESHGIEDRIAQIFYNLGFLSVKTILPTGLSPLYLLKADFGLGRTSVLLAVAAVISITGISLDLAYRRKNYGPLIAWLSAGIVILPVAGVAHSGSQITADRYTYLAAIPFTFLLAAALHHIVTRWNYKYLIVPAPLLLLGFTIASVQQTAIWRDAHSLWSQAIAHDPTNYVAYYNRATAGSGGQNLQDDYNDLTRAIELNPNYAGAYNNRGRLLLHANKIDEALEDFRNAVRSNPNLAQPYINIGVIHLDHLNQPEEAAVAYQKALALEPDNYAALANLGVIHQRQGDRIVAIDYFTEALASNANSGLVWLNLGLCHFELDQLDQAEPALIKAIRLAPEEPECWLTLGKLQLTQDRPSQAVESIQQALKIASPDWPHRGQARQLLQQAKNR